MRRLLLLAVAPLLMVGCGPAAIEGGFDSANPAARMYAMEQAVRAGDRGAVPQIIEQLESDDPAVRLLAIGSLEALTGQTFGYRHYDPLLKRRQAVRRWREAYEAGELDAARQEAAAPSLGVAENG